MREKDLGNGWKQREILDPETGKSYRQYFYKNKRAPRALLKDKISRQLAGYVLIEKDLRNVKDWLNRIDKLYPPESRTDRSFISSDRETFNLIKGLFVASLTFYGKCFTQCEGRRVKLERSFIADDYKEIHDDIMNLRHNFAAHSGADDFEEVKVVLILPPKKNSKADTWISSELRQIDFGDAAPNEINFIKLVEHVRNKVKKKMDQVSEKILNEEVIPKRKDYWYQKAKK